jgi:hypothetical protein
MAYLKVRHGGVPGSRQGRQTKRADLAQGAPCANPLAGGAAASQSAGAGGFKHDAWAGPLVGVIREASYEASYEKRSGA